MKNEESKEEIVAYQYDIHERDNNTPLTNIGLNQMSNKGESEEKKMVINTQSLQRKNIKLFRKMSRIKISLLRILRFVR